MSHIKILKRMMATLDLRADEYKAMRGAIKAIEVFSSHDTISRSELRKSKFPETTNLYSVGWNDALEAIISNANPVNIGVNLRERQN